MTAFGCRAGLCARGNQQKGFSTNGAKSKALKYTLIRICLHLGALL